jgi:hypothetical protein
MPSKTAAKAARPTKPTMSDQHKAALAVGREEGRAVRRYLEALAANKGKRGRRRTRDGISARLEAIQKELADADPLTRLHLVQERLDLETELAHKGDPVDLEALEDSFVRAAKGYSARKRISYTAWRELGVSPSVLRRAGIARTRP